MQGQAATAAVSQAPARKSMTCAVCGLEVLYHTYGPMLEGAPLWEFAEEGYFSVDAFSVQGRRRPLLLGAKCSACMRDVCVASTCSVYQTRRLCMRCAPPHKPET